MDSNNTTNKTGPSSCIGCKFSTSIVNWLLGSKAEFLLKKKLFDNAPQTVESLLEERRDLYQRLQLSRDELDSYIRYMHKMCDEKGQLSDELAGLKASNETLTHKCKRLENQNKLLVKESNDLMKMLADFGPKELYNYSPTNPNTEEAIINKLKESLQVIFDENGKLHQEQDLLKNELRQVTMDLNESQRKVNELNRKMEHFDDGHNDDHFYKAEYEKLLALHSNCNADSRPKKYLGSSNRNSADNSMATVDTNDQYFSIDSSTPPSIPVFQGDNPSILNSTFCKNSFNVDIFDDFPYQLRSYDVYSDSEAMNLEDSSAYKSALERVSRNTASISEVREEDLPPQDDSGNTISISHNRTPSHHSRNTSESDRTKFKLPRKISTIDSSVDVFGLIVSVRELHQSVRSLFKLLAIAKENESFDEDCGLPPNDHPQNIPMPNAEELLNMDEINTSAKAFEILSGSIESIKKEVEQLSQLLSKMNSEFTDAQEENAMLAKEITALKYALTCRIELKNSRTAAAAPPTNKCNCDEKTAEFNQQRADFEKTIAELNTKVEELAEERSNLFSLITQIANSSDSGYE